MKCRLIVIAAALATAVTGSAAFAAPVTCTTNVSRDPLAGATFFTLSGMGRGTQVAVSVVSNGGMAHWVVAPRKFMAEFRAYGPEIVEYFNPAQDFSLEITYAPAGGQIHGTFTGKILGSPYRKLPVICAQAMN